MAGAYDDRDGVIWMDGAFVPWREAKVHVLTHALVPANDGGLAPGQAAIGAAQLLNYKNMSREGNAICASEFQAAS